MVVLVTTTQVAKFLYFYIKHVKRSRSREFHLFHPIYYLLHCLVCTQFPEGSYMQVQQNSLD